MSLITNSGLSHIATLVLKSAKLRHRNSIGLCVSLTHKGVAEAIGTFAESARKLARPQSEGYTHYVRVLLANARLIFRSESIIFVNHITKASFKGSSIVLRSY